MATIYDVARLAGVSPATVSRALNGGPVAAQRAELVRAAAVQLGFVPDRAARRLNNKRSDVVALVIPDIENPFFTSLARGVEDVAQNAGLSIVLCNADDDPDKQQRYLEAARAERMAGLLLTPASASSPDLVALLAQGCAVVAIDRRPTGHPVDMVTIDGKTGALEAVRHLAAEGHTRIACLLGPRESTTARRRHAGYRAGLEACGLAYDRDLVRHTDYREAGGYAATASLLAAAAPPDAILATSSLLGLGAIEAMLDAGVTPPAIGLVSFGGATWSRLIRPPITTVWQPAHELGREAARLLLRRLAEPDAAPSTVVLQTTLCIEGSSRRHK